jgi:oligopeptidase B
MTAWFSQTIFSLIDRGFIFCIAHIRGGSELGRAWYEDGRTDKKLNTFYDFIDVTEYFSKQSHVDAKNIFAMGGSAGGLLMGAITNLRPDLYKGIVAQVPFVDVLTTMLDDSIPLTTGEYDEWGNPNDKYYYDYISKYSPYDNITAKTFPHVLATTGLHDSQVQYWEPAKWVAKLRDYNQGHSLILLKTDMEAGHGGASGRYEQLKEKAFEFSFILSVLNKTKE